MSVAALLVTLKTTMTIKRKKEDKNSLIWTDSQLRIELEDIQKTYQIAPESVKDNLDPLNFEFSYNNPAYEDF